MIASCRMCGHPLKLHTVAGCGFYQAAYRNYGIVHVPCDCGEAIAEAPSRCPHAFPGYRGAEQCQREAGHDGWCETEKYAWEMAPQAMARYRVKDRGEQ